MASELDLRPRTVGEILDGSFFLYRRHFGRFLLVATMISLPTLVVAALTAGPSAEITRDATQRMIESSTNVGRPMEQMGEMLSAYAALMPLAVLQLVLQSLSRGGGVAVMTVATVVAVNRSQMPSWGALIRLSAPRLAGVVLATLLQSIVLLSMACCFPFYPILIAFMAPMAPLIVLEQGGLERALRRSALGAIPVARWMLLPVVQVLDSIKRAFVLSMHGMSIVRGSIAFFFLWAFVTLFVSGVSLGASSLFESQTVLYWTQYYLEVLFLPAIGVATALWTLDLMVRREGLDLFARRVDLA